MSSISESENPTTEVEIPSNWQELDELLAHGDFNVTHAIVSKETAEWFQKVHFKYLEAHDIKIRLNPEVPYMKACFIDEEVSRGTLIDSTPKEIWTPPSDKLI